MDDWPGGPKIATSFFAAVSLDRMLAAQDPLTRWLANMSVRARRDCRFMVRDALDCADDGRLESSSFPTWRNRARLSAACIEANWRIRDSVHQARKRVDCA